MWNIAAGKPQGKGALCCFYTGWTSSSIALIKHKERCKRPRSLFSCLPAQQQGREPRQQVTSAAGPAAGSTLFILGVCKDFTRAYRKAAASQLWGPLGSISIFTDASLSGNSIDIFLPCLQSKLLTFAWLSVGQQERHLQHPPSALLIHGVSRTHGHASSSMFLSGPWPWLLGQIPSLVEVSLLDPCPAYYSVPFLLSSLHHTSISERVGPQSPENVASKKTIVP